MVALNDGDVPPAERIFQAWPHSDLDFSLILTNLAAWNPKAVAIVPPLSWPEESAPFISSLANSIKALPRRVLGSIGEYSDYVEEDQEFQSHRHLVLTNVTGDVEKLPSITGFITSPTPEVSDGSVVGFTDIDLGAGIEVPGDGTLLVPMLARVGAEVVAGFPLAALLVHYGVGQESVVVDLGVSISGPGFSIPVDHSGQFVLEIDSMVEIAKLDADVFALSIERGGKENEASSVIKELVESDTDFSKLQTLDRRLVLVGQDDKGSRRFAVSEDLKISRAEVFCQAIAAMTSGNRLRRSPSWAGWVIAGGILIIGFFQLRWRRASILKSGFCVLMLGAIASLIVYQSFHYWFPVLRPLVVLICCTVVAFLSAEKPGEASPQTG